MLPSSASTTSNLAVTGVSGTVENRPARQVKLRNTRGEKLRSDSAEAAAAMARQGRYQEVSANLRVKEVKVGEHERFVVCHNPDAADRDAAVRANLVERLEAMIATSDRLTSTKRAE